MDPRPARHMEKSDAGATLRGAIADFEAQGYLGQFVSRPDAGVQCLSCRATMPAEHVHLHAICRIEGTSDPADEAIVAALECPGCEVKGTGVFMYGPEASPEDLAVVHDLHDERTPSSAMRRAP